MQVKFDWESKEQIENIVKTSKTWTECLRKLNLGNQTRNKERLKKYINLYEIEHNHIHSSVWKNEKNLRDVVAKSFCKSDILRSMNLAIHSGNFDTLNKYVKKYNISISHFNDDSAKEKKANALKESQEKRKLKHEEIFIENSACNRTSIRKIVKKFSLLEYKCAFGHEAIWEGKELVLHLDHINGIPSDNRIENLRYLCPNCHSQTTTYCRGDRVFKREKSIRVIEKKGDCQKV